MTSRRCLQSPFTDATTPFIPVRAERCTLPPHCEGCQVLGPPRALGWRCEPARSESSRSSVTVDDLELAASRVAWFPFEDRRFKLRFGPPETTRPLRSPICQQRQARCRDRWTALGFAIRTRCVVTVPRRAGVARDRYRPPGVSSRPERAVTMRVIRPGQPEPPDEEWRSMSVAERLAMVWTLTELCLDWNREDDRALRLQRSVVHVQRPRR